MVQHIPVRVLFLAALFSLHIPSIYSQQNETQETPPEKGFFEGRIVTRREVENAERKGLLFPFKVLSSPVHAFNGVVKSISTAVGGVANKQKVTSSTAKDSKPHFELLLGGLGEGTGVGGGAAYSFYPSEHQQIRFFGKVTHKNYLQVGGQWIFPFDKHRFQLEAVNEWRPKDNFYGIGNDSLSGQRSNFLLSQRWIGAAWEMGRETPLQFGLRTRALRISTDRGRDDRLSSPPDLFGFLPGFGTNFWLQSSGVYLRAEGGDEYDWGGKFHSSAFYQQGWGVNNLRFFTYEVFGEGRIPVLSQRGALAIESTLTLIRPTDSSDPLPFFLLASLGGGSSLRGFRTDRFYGRNALLATLEYRYQIHPYIQTLIFFDEGQVEERAADLAFGRGHRGYGLGFRLKRKERTFIRLDFGRSRETYRIHIGIGDRLPVGLSIIND